jgi:hypothetical protein
MQLPSGESPEQIQEHFGRARARILLALLGLALAAEFLGGVDLARAACSNPVPVVGFAAPCPVLSASPTTLSPAGMLSLTAAPQAGTDYVHTQAYYAKNGAWVPFTLSGSGAYMPTYSSGVASGSLNASILSTLPLGTNYVVVWDWLWDATAQCYKGPDLNQCNTGQWRVHEFSLTATPSPTPAPSPTPTPTPSGNTFTLDPSVKHQTMAGLLLESGVPGGLSIQLYSGFLASYNQYSTQEKPKIPYPGKRLLRHPRHNAGSGETRSATERGPQQC